MRAVNSQDWVLLIHQLPPKPTNLRVRIWRRLQKLGAIAIKNSVYVLPVSEKAYEDFQWLKQDIESSGGEAAVFKAGSVEGATDDEIIAAFRKARADEFSSLAAELDGLTGMIREQSRSKHLSAGRLAAHETELDKLHGELERISSNDFFNAPNRTEAFTSYERARKAIQAGQSPKQKPPRANSNKTSSISQYQGCRWVTRKNLHIDRLASAWLIKQFIDKHPRFYFVSDNQEVERGIPFDMFGAEFTHHGEDCTFETLLKRFGLDENRALSEIAEIVHDIDLKDDKFHRLEAPGVNTIIDGLIKQLNDDRKLLQQTSVIFDGLYSRLSESNRQTKKSRGGK
jgi:hypothetical protein